MSGSGISWACKPAPRSRQITTPVPHHSSFLQAGCPSCHRVPAHQAAVKRVCVCVCMSVCRSDRVVHAHPSNAPARGPTSLAQLLSLRRVSHRRSVLGRRGQVCIRRPLSTVSHGQPRSTLCVCLSLCFSVCERVSVCLSVCLFVSLSLSVCLSLCFSVCERVSACLSVCLSLCFSLCVSVCLSVCVCIRHLFCTVSRGLTLKYVLSRNVTEPAKICFRQIRILCFKLCGCGCGFSMQSWLVPLS